MPLPPFEVQSPQDTPNWSTVTPDCNGVTCLQMLKFGVIKLQMGKFGVIIVQLGTLGWLSFKCSVYFITSCLLYVNCYSFFNKFGIHYNLAILNIFLHFYALCLLKDLFLLKNDALKPKFCQGQIIVIKFWIDKTID